MTNQEKLDILNEIDLPYGAFFHKISPSRWGEARAIVDCQTEKTDSAAFQHEVVKRSLATLKSLGIKRIANMSYNGLPVPEKSRQAMMIKGKGDRK